MAAASGSFSVELEHAIGFAAIPSGLHYHPSTSEYIYASGACIVVCDFTDPHNHVFLRGHTGDITCLVLSPSGRYLASGERGKNADVLVWDFQTKRLVYRFSEHDDVITALAFSDDEKLLASVGGDPLGGNGQMFVWDMQTGNINACANQVPAVTTCVTWGGFMKDIKRRETAFYQLCTGGEKAIAIWALDPTTGELVPTPVRQQQVRNITTVRFSADHETVYAGTTTGDFVVVNVKNKMSVGICPACSSGVCAIEPFADPATGAQLIMAGGGDGSVLCFDADLGLVAQTTLPGRVVSLSFNRDRSEFVAGTSAGYVHRVRTADMEALVVCENHAAAVTGVAYAPEASDRFATVSEDMTVRVWDASEYRVIASAHIKDAGLPTALAYSLDALVSGWDDGVIRGHHPEDGMALFEIANAHRGGVTALVMSGNQRFIISGGAEGEIRVWELRSRDLVSHLKEHTMPVTGLAIFDDDAHAISCSRDRSFLCWDLRAEKRIANHTQRMGGINAVTLSPDQTQVLTVGQEKKISFWDLREEQPLRQLDYSRVAYGGQLAPAPVSEVGLDDSLSAEATCIAVSHNGKLLATGGTDCSMKLWGVGSGELIMDGVGHSGTVRDLKFSPDDRQLVSVGMDGCIFVWNIYEM